ncbi:39S ribosomal protein L16, mitochondrial [Portunus trituberculatus]|uniref:Large ribosomal subunit protein uL16m n=1 Tax=Portunus trituberculatus TaxID=210409 RepID=A0A5B7DLN2_PORTR|nr:39S ribosomal protein L16, mitochondrial [Portunus trituberculatus]
MSFSDKAAVWTQKAGYKNFPVPPNYDHIQVPTEKQRLKFYQKVPQYPGNIRPPKMTKRLDLIRGEEEIHRDLLLKQYGIVCRKKKTNHTFLNTQARRGGMLRHGHIEMIRMTIARKIDMSKMFAIWRIDAPWKPITKKGQGKRMGGGKGSIDHYVTPIKAERVIIEVGGKCSFEEVSSYTLKPLLLN